MKIFSPGGHTCHSHTNSWPMASTGAGSAASSSQGYGNRSHGSELADGTGSSNLPSVQDAHAANIASLRDGPNSVIDDPLALGEMIQVKV